MERNRSGFSVPEVLVAVGVICLLLALIVPWLATVRESARRMQCQRNLSNLTMALQAYHDTYQSFPPAAVWNTNATVSLALHETKHFDLITQQNWLQLLLPQLDETELAQQFAAQSSIASPELSDARIKSVPIFLCPSDDFSTASHRFHFQPSGREEPIEFARGNYAMSAGTSDVTTHEPTTSRSGGDFHHLKMDAEKRVFQMWGNGMAGINRCFSREDFANGQATMIALEEVRSGVHELDIRGTWALGQIGASITFGHGVNGDNFSPNRQWVRADDIQGCGELHRILGAQRLRELEMPCVNYVDKNQQATARSRHPGGVNVSFLDGSCRFISNEIDPGLWHVMHSRETPAEVLAQDFETHLESDEFMQQEWAAEASPTASSSNSITNSIGMRFVKIPAGEFTMGTPDVGFQNPDEAVEHFVQLTQDYYLGVFEVTEAEFDLVMEKSEFDESNALPVVNITWNEAVEFCERLSNLTAEKVAHRKYRLPTEAEWEYACRSGTSEPFPFRNDRAPEDRSGVAVAVYPSLPLTPVGTYAPNSFGVHDMRGNAWEWTADWFDRDYYSRSPSVNPQGPKYGYLKIVRGSDWRFTGERCLLDASMQPPWKKNPVVGFRVVLEQTSH